MIPGNNRVDGVNLYGRKTGTTTEVNLGRFTATPARATVPLSGDSPEQWEFQTRAVKRNEEIGQPDGLC